MSDIYAQRFAGQSAVVTGGASGLGRALGQRLAAEGAKVSLWDRDAGMLEEAAKFTRATNTQVVDVTRFAEVEAAAAQSSDVLGGRIDILIACAGITGPTVTLWDYPVEAWQRVMDVDLNGVFYSCKATIPYMLRRDYGRIVNIASVAGKEGNPNASAYSAAKAAVIGMTKSIGKELAKTGIRVNAVTPATFQSPILSQLTQRQVDYMLQKIPMGRIGQISEVASLVCWLASSECSFSTGATFDISGGRTTY